MNKILDENSLKKVIENLKKNKKRIVLCHGVFDLLHIGHVEYFKEAKNAGDVLIVSVTNDKYVNKALKGTKGSLFKKISTIVEGEGERIATMLVNLVLKKDLKDLYPIKEQIF